MNEKAFRLHCIAGRRKGYWVARCLDFTLYAVGDTLEEARAKLEAQIEEYLYDALEGEDRAFAPQLLLRRAPAVDWAYYYALAFLSRCSWLKGRLESCLFDASPEPPYRHA